MAIHGGKSARRRAKNAIAAQTGNLYKAQFGKAKKWDALPEPPTSKEKMQRLPRATLKMRSLMAASEKGKSVDASAVTSSSDTPKSVKAEPRKGKNKVKAAGSGSQGEASTSGRDTETLIEAAKATPKGLDVTGNVARGVIGGTGDAFAGSFVSKTKAKRKAHLNEKKKLKKLRAQVAKAGGNVPEKEEDDFKEDYVEFGETSAAPPKVTLKRRHWDAEQTADEKKLRNATAMRKHMKLAEERLQKMRQAPLNVGDKKKMQEEEQLRAQHIAAYRNSKRTTPAPAATLDSMKALIT